MRCFVAPALALALLPAAAEVLTVDQKDKQFGMPVVRIKVGDSIRFVNSDPYFHNVFSLSDPKTFDLGSYPQGQSRTLIFDRAGEIEVECAIHPTMKMKITVSK